MCSHDTIVIKTPRKYTKLLVKKSMVRSTLDRKSHGVYSNVLADPLLSDGYTPCSKTLTSENVMTVNFWQEVIKNAETREFVVFVK